MGQPELDNLVRVRQLKAEPGTQAEFDGLLRSGAARLRDVANKTFSSESRFDLACNAAHALSLAALRWHGYRSENRYVVFQCLTHTLAFAAAQWRALDQAHRKRNLAEYEGEVEIDKALLAALLRVSARVKTAVRSLVAVATPPP